MKDGFIWQAINDGTKEPADVYAYLGMAGTSQAAPHVSGVVALLQGARADAGLPALTPDEVLSIIQAPAPAPRGPPPQPPGAGLVAAPPPRPADRRRGESGSRPCPTRRAQ